MRMEQVTRAGIPSSVAWRIVYDIFFFVGMIDQDSTSNSNTPVERLLALEVMNHLQMGVDEDCDLMKREICSRYFHPSRQL